MDCKELIYIYIYINTHTYIDICFSGYRGFCLLGRDLWRPERSQMIVFNLVEIITYIYSTLDSQIDC